jgi:hypothetical protein
LKGKKVVTIEERYGVSWPIHVVSEQAEVVIFVNEATT